MRQVMQKSGYTVVASLALVLLVSGPLAAQTANFQLTSAGSGAVLAGVYTSPYQGDINGGTTIPVICDDFADNSYVPEDWTANVTTFTASQVDTLAGSSYSNSLLKWQNATAVWGLNQAQAYTVATVLSVEILTSPTASRAQEDLSFALWDLFDPTGADTANWGTLTSTAPTGDSVNTWLTANPVSSSYDSPGDLTAAQADVTAAIALASNSTTLGTFLSSNNVENVTIYSYAGGGVTQCGGCSPAPQEFITVNMTEPPSIAVFAVYFLLGGGALLFFGRRQIFRNARN